MDLLRFLVLLALFSACVCEDWSAACNRTRCVCKWMNGKKSALCNGAQLQEVPDGLSTDLQVLSLNENRVAQLGREEFLQRGLEHLQRIFVRNSRVRHVHRDAFKNLKILVEIDLSENAIEALEPGTFSGNERLRVLYLHGNPLTSLAADQFPALPHLRTLDLHDCLLQSVHERAFARVDQLEYLSLQNNSLATLPAAVFAHLHLLKTLVLGDNPWHCDCHLRAFRNWYVRTNYQKLVCALPPRHSHADWDQLAADQLGCLPAVQLTADHNVQGEVFGPSNASFHCLVSGDPLPQVAWELNGNPLSEGENVVLGSAVVAEGVWSNLTILNVTNYDSGTYGCRAWNSVGEVEQNATLFLPEVVEHVIVKTHETFWYFGLIVGTFGTVFGLLLVSVTVCYCRRAALQRSARRRHRQKKRQQLVAQGAATEDGRALKGSVSFTEREKRLLDLSLTNDRVDSCELVTPSTTVTLNHSVSVGHRHPAEEQQQPVAAQEQFPLHLQLFPPPPAEFSCAQNAPSAAPATHAHLYSGAVEEGHPAHQYSTAAAQGYGNIYISVAVAKDPDLLNLPSLNRSSGGGEFMTEGCRNSASISNAITNNQSNNIIILNGSEGTGRFFQPQTTQKELEFPNGLVNYATFQNGNHFGSAVTNSEPQIHTCAFATLPRTPRQPQQFFSSIRANGHSNAGNRNSICSGQVTPIVINNFNIASVSNAIQFKDLPPTIPENEEDPVAEQQQQRQRQGLEAAGATLTRPLGKIRGVSRDGGVATSDLRSGGKLHGFPQAAPLPGAADGNCVGADAAPCPTNYDSIGRRTTANGNSATKLPAACEYPSGTGAVGKGTPPS